VRFLWKVNQPLIAHTNVFSTPEYLSCVAEAFFAGRRYDIADFVVCGQTFRLLRLPGRRLRRPTVVSWVPFLDFLEPAAGSVGTKKDAPKYLPSVSHGRVTIGEWQAMCEQKNHGMKISPLIDYTAFPSWEAFVAHSRSSTHPGFRSQRARLQRKLDKEHGVELRWHDEDPLALVKLIEWKGAQYRSEGYVDCFQSPRLRRLFDLLRERGRLIITTMRVGGKIVSGHAGMEHDGRFYYWLPAYDKAWAKEGVGSMMIEWMMQQAYERGHKEFDFLLGDEEYKLGYATHARIVGPLGTPPLVDRAWRPLRGRLMVEVRKHERVYKGLQELKRRVKYLRLD
jgi:hypothetical protein